MRKMWPIAIATLVKGALLNRRTLVVVSVTALALLLPAAAIAAKPKNGHWEGVYDPTKPPLSQPPPCTDLPDLGVYQTPFFLPPDLRDQYPCPQPVTTAPGFHILLEFEVAKRGKRIDGPKWAFFAPCTAGLYVDFDWGGWPGNPRTILGQGGVFEIDPFRSGFSGEEEFIQDAVGLSSRDSIRAKFKSKKVAKGTLRSERFGIGRGSADCDTGSMPFKAKRVSR